MNEDKLENAINRAQRAEVLIRDELLTEAFTKLEADYIAAWRITPARDVIAREKLWQAVNVLGLVRQHLDTVLNNGKLARADLNMRNSRAKQAA